MVVLLEPHAGALTMLSQSLASFLRTSPVVLRTGRLEHPPLTTAEKFQVAGRAAGPGVLAVCWCERVGPVDFLNLVDVRSRRLVVRAVGRCTEPEGAETAALIVRTALEGILAEAHRPVRLPHRALRNKPRPRPRRPRPRLAPGRPGRGRRPVEGRLRSHLRGGGSPFLLGFFYRGDFASYETVYASGGGLSLGVRLTRHWRFEFAFWVRQPIEGASRDVSLVTYGYGLSLGGGYLARWGRWRVGGMAALVAMLYNLDVRESSGVVAAQEKNWDVELCGEAGGLLSFRLASATWLDLELGLQVPILGVADYYIVDVQGDGQRLIRFLPVRPFLRMGIAFGGI